MFDISWGKLVIIGVVALLVIGPKELPGVLRMVGQWMGKMRRMASEFQGQFQEAMREAEMADLKKQFDDTAASFTSTIDPSGLKTDIEKMINDPLAPVATDTATATSTPATPPSDPAAPLATPATATPEATPPADPVALGTAPAAPATPTSEAAPAVDVAVPMPELPPPLDQKDFAPAPAAPAPAAPTPATEGGKAA
jgi:sec-independent protein translocase protein TatB